MHISTFQVYLLRKVEAMSTSTEIALNLLQNSPQPEIIFPEKCRSTVI